ncbi:MAG: N-acetylglucosamine/diacetylchitobiose ABC transporter substrate-binding protein [Jiangellaceae bacterium]
MTTPNDLSRRRFLQRAAVATLMATSSGTLLSACAGGGGDDPGNADGVGEKSADNPFGVKADAALEVVIFKGGYGDDYAKFHQELYKEKYPNAQITHKGITDIRAQLQPRFNAGNPPDLIFNAGGNLLPLAPLLATGQLADLTPLYDADSIDKPGTKIRDTLEPIALEQGRATGETTVFGVQYAVTVYALWYDQTLFESKGWQPAKTWTEFMTLCEDMKKAGVAPMAHQGKHPNYVAQVLWDMAVKHGGHEVIKAIDSLEPNAWKHPSIKLAAEAMLELKGKGYIMQGTEGLDHIQSQTRWNEGKAAFIPSGSWLENEQKPVVATVNPAFATTAAPTPLLDGAKLPFECTEVTVSEPFIVPAQAKNVAGAMELLRLALSKEGAAKFTELTGAPTIVKGAAEGITLTTGAESASKLLASGGENNWNPYYPGWYPTMSDPTNSAVGELVAARITADEFLNRCQAAADDAAKDPNTQKRTRN